MARTVRAFGCAVVAGFLATRPAVAAPALDLKLIASGLTNVTSITTPPDGSGRLFFTQQNGQIRIFNGTQLLGTNFLDISSLISFVGSGNERGVLCLSFSPGYATNGLLYVTYNAPNGDITLASYAASANPNIANTNVAQVLLSIGHSTNTNHNAGQMQFGPDGYLYLTTGDGGGACDTPNNAQTLSTRLGKMLRIDVNTNTGYRIPPTNPFIATNGAAPEIWAYGLRNPWRFSFDRVTGDLWIGDVGQNLREEVDFQPAGYPGGENYGWRYYEGFLTNTCSGTFSNVPTTLPILDYTHVNGACAIIGGYRYRGGQITPLDGTYIFGDYCSGQIWGATTNGSGGWTTNGLLLAGFHISTFGQDANGEVYVAQYSNSGGGIYRLVAHDSVGDGIADWWRAQYFGGSGTSTNSQSCVTCDADGTGQNNLFKYIAGLDPTNRASIFVLKIARVAGQTNRQNLSYSPIAAGRLYTPQLTTDLVSGPYTNLTGFSGPTTNGTQATITDLNATQSNKFYRLRISLP